MISYYITCTGILNMYVNYVQLIQVSNIHSAYKTYTIYIVYILKFCTVVSFYDITVVM